MAVLSCTLEDGTVKKTEQPKLADEAVQLSEINARNVVFDNESLLTS